MDKILLVTGASSDIGSELVRNVSQNYKKVIAHYYHWNENLECLKRETGDKIIFLQSDFSDLDSVTGLIHRIKEQGLEPDHIVHLPAPKMKIQKFVKEDWETFQNGWETSVHSLVEILQAFLPHMQKQKYGKIVLMLTSCTLDLPPKFQAAYTTVKYAMLGLMKSLAVDYMDKGITVNGVSPDMIQTKFLSELPEHLIEQYAEKRPEKRILRVEEVLPVLSFLLSEGAAHVNGMNLGVQ